MKKPEILLEVAPLPEVVTKALKRGFTGLTPEEKIAIEPFITAVNYKREGNYGPVWLTTNCEVAEGTTITISYAKGDPKPGGGFYPKWTTESTAVSLSQELGVEYNLW